VTAASALSPVADLRRLGALRDVPGGGFVMGSDAHYPEERPAHRVHVAAFGMEAHPVTNAAFRRFVVATGHVTVAEQAPDPAAFPDAAPEELVPGSLVFTPPPGPVPLTDWRRWWQYVPGADWRHPGGPGTTLHGLDRHPVVHVGWEDAAAYAAWAGRELPTEAEWEHAARGGSPDGAEYAWGDELTPRGRPMANTWSGRFPWENTAPPAQQRTTPVGQFPANGYGLADMIGNVWEWTASPWTEDHSATPVSTGAVHACCGAAPQALEDERRVTKGGSHLCSPYYCARYRPPARQGHGLRSTTGHLGFRCVVRDGSEVGAP
jgi:formylglycine-generating enzyme required for sulfatase activity